MKSIAKKLVQKEFFRTKLAKLYASTYPSSDVYWELRYSHGGTSGAGSYGKMARFKANVIQDFLESNNIKRVIEWGCGDGNQLSLIEFEEYIGFDVSPTAIDICKAKFGDDDNKSFFLYDPDAFVDNLRLFNCRLSISLDVIFHLTEDVVYEKYMRDLFGSSDEFVIIYSSNGGDFGDTANHVKHRNHEHFVENNLHMWELCTKIDNEYPYDSQNPDGTSFCDFFIYEKSAE
jgi:SAM-dependent methyltransferase